MFRSFATIIREPYTEPGQSYTFVKTTSKITSLRITQCCGSMCVTLWRVYCVPCRVSLYMACVSHCGVCTVCHVESHYTRHTVCTPQPDARAVTTLSYS